MSGASLPVARLAQGGDGVCKTGNVKRRFKRVFVERRHANKQRVLAKHALDERNGPPTRPVTECLVIGRLLHLDLAGFVLVQPISHRAIVAVGRDHVAAGVEIEHGRIFLAAQNQRDAVALIPAAIDDLLGIKRHCDGGAVVHGGFVAIDLPALAACFQIGQCFFDFSPHAGELFGVVFKFFASGESIAGNGCVDERREQRNGDKNRFHKTVSPAFDCIQADAHAGVERGIVA